MILADVHNHTLVSHGEATVAQMYEAARARGLSWYGFSEHSPLPPGYACPLYHGDLAGLCSGRAAIEARRIPARAAGRGT